MLCSNWHLLNSVPSLHVIPLTVPSPQWPSIHAVELWLINQVFTHMHHLMPGLNQQSLWQLLTEMYEVLHLALRCVIHCERHSNTNLILNG